MIRVIVIKKFTLKKFDELKNLKRYNPNLSKYGQLYVNDEFNCTKDMANYLMGNNKDGEVVVRVIEVEPEIKVLETRTQKKATKKKTSKK